jgi:hypothetical protein
LDEKERKVSKKEKNIKIGGKKDEKNNNVIDSSDVYCFYRI